MTNVFDIKELNISFNNINYQQEYISLPDTCVSIYINSRKQIALVKQYRPILQSYTLELPGGGQDDGESRSNAAKRELFEETGLKATSIEPLMSIALSVGTSSELVHIFIVTTVEQESSLQSTEKGVHAIWVDQNECLKMIKNGEIIDAKTIVAIQNTPSINF